MGTEEDFRSILAMLNAAKAHLKRPRIVMRGLQIREAGTRYPGSYYVTARHGAEYWGRIDPNGRYMPARSLPGDATPILAQLRELAADPVKAAARYGRETGECCFCARQLTDPRSTQVGYGPICAARFGLPWGT
jgi:hypothetical protein